MKHFAAPLLLAPLLAFAQPPQGQMTEQAFFNRMKQQMLPIMTDSIPAMEQTRACVNASNNSADLNNCVAIMTAFQAKVEGRAQKPANVPGHEGKPPQPPRLEWSPGLKKQILEDIRISIKNTHTAKGCLEKSNNNQEMSSCMAAAGIEPPQPRR